MLKGMKRGKLPNKGITADNLKRRGDIVLMNVGKLFSECLRTLKVLLAWKRANTILVHKKW